MNKSELETIIIEALQELEAGSAEQGSQIGRATVPLQDLGFFDSLLAIETTLVLEERLGCSCDADSIFKDTETARPLSISEIASRLAQKKAV